MEEKEHATIFHSGPTTVISKRKTKKVRKNKYNENDFLFIYTKKICARNEETVILSVSGIRVFPIVQVEGIILLLGLD